MAREETPNVLEENGPGSNSLDDAAGVEEQTGSLSGKAAALPGDGHVLAGESPGEEIRNGDCVNPPGSVTDGDTSISLRWFDTKSRHVREAGDAGEPCCEDFTPPGVGFALEDDGSTGPFDSEVEPADA